MEAPWETLMPEGWEPAVPFERCFDAQYGLEVLGWDTEDGTTRGRVPVTEPLLNHAGGLHGGVFAAVAEALASRGTALAVIPHGQAAMGLGNDTTVIHNPSDGSDRRRGARARTRRASLAVGVRGDRRERAPVRVLARDGRRPRHMTFP